MTDFSKFKIGVIGTGSVGRRHAQNLLALGVKNVVLCSENRGGGDYLGELQALPLVTRYDAILDGDYDAVVIGNSTDRHIDYAIRAVQRNVNVFLEKPAGISAAEVAGLVEVNQRQKKVLAVGCQHRFNPLLVKAREIYRSGALGQIVSVGCTMGEYLPNYHPNEDYRAGYAAKEKLGGGVMRTQIHDINYLRWICGELGLLCAYGGKTSELEIDVEDNVTALLGTAEGITVSLHMDYLQKKPYRILEVLGIDGGFRWSYHDNVLKHWDGAGVVTTYGQEAALNRNQLFLDCMTDFLRCIQNSDKPRSDLNDGYADMCLVDKIRASIGFPR